MFLGRVIGHVWSTVKWKELDGLKFLLIKPYHLEELAQGNGNATQGTVCRDLVVAADLLGACVGEDVIIAYGHAGRVGLEELMEEQQKPYHPVDAAVGAIVDSFHTLSASELAPIEQKEVTHDQS